MSLLLSPKQFEIINTYGTAKNYPAMYNYIATEMKAKRIANASSDQIYWFEQAAKINARDVSSPASVFIRAATVAGLSSSGARTDAAHIQQISDDIAGKVFGDISKNGVIPDFDQQLNADIRSAIDKGGMTIGGWRGAFYYWDAPYTQRDGTRTTVGDAIISSPDERAKFVSGMLAATGASINKFGFDGLGNEPAFWLAFFTGLKNMGASAPVFAYQLLIELKDEFAKYGPEAVQRLETEIRKLYGLSAALPAENILASLDPSNLLASNDDITSDLPPIPVPV